MRPRFRGPRRVRKNQSPPAKHHTTRPQCRSGAEYVGVSAPKFIDAAKTARYPAPIRHGKRQVWDLRALDLAMYRESGIANGMTVGAEDAVDHDAMTLRSNIAKRRVGNARTR
jgi:hypothetical protein